MFKHILHEYKNFYVSVCQDISLLHLPNPTQRTQPLGWWNSVQPLCTYFMYVRSKIYPCLKDNRWRLYSKYQLQTAWGSNRCMLWEPYETHKRVVRAAGGTHSYHSLVDLTLFVIVLYYFMKKHFGSQNVKQTVRPSVCLSDRTREWDGPSLTTQLSVAAFNWTDDVTINNAVAHTKCVNTSHCCMALLRHVVHTDRSRCPVSQRTQSGTITKTKC
jgi:hypothetical protein